MTTTALSDIHFQAYELVERGIKEESQVRKDIRMVKDGQTTTLTLNMMRSYYIASHQHQLKKVTLTGRNLPGHRSHLKNNFQLIKKFCIFGLKLQQIKTEFIFNKFFVQAFVL